MAPVSLWEWPVLNRLPNPSNVVKAFTGSLWNNSTQTTHHPTEQDACSDLPTQLCIGCLCNSVPQQRSSDEASEASCLKICQGGSGTFEGIVEEITKTDIKRHLSLESKSILSKRSSSTINSSALAGGLIGGVVVLLLVILLTVIWIRRRQSKTKMAPSTLFKATHVLDIRASSPHCQRGSQYIDLYPDKAPSQSLEVFGRPSSSASTEETFNPYNEYLSLPSPPRALTPLRADYS
ncbi:hypothetical protein VKT23_004338 [Stygiomarasmius scandens]|uniref:Uncharacterized protein n=1 Tax=Marasmiellus scandens TaxID=2682957 RepID=A0ABR1JUM7_9AGAR